jgi:hypothetical protein
MTSQDFWRALTFTVVVMIGLVLAGVLFLYCSGMGDPAPHF